MVALRPLAGFKLKIDLEMPAQALSTSFASAGNANVAPAAFHVMMKPRGAICNLDCKYCYFLSKEMMYPGSRFRMADDLVIQEISLIGSRCGPFPPAIRLLESKHIRVDPLIHARYPLLDGVQAMEKAAQRGVRKVLLQMT